MLKHIVRIGPDWLRIPVLCLMFPMHWLGYVLRAGLPAAWGGHPNKRRLLCADFYATPWSLFWAAWDGFFVPSTHPNQ